MDEGAQSEAGRAVAARLMQTARACFSSRAVSSAVPHPRPGLGGRVHPKPVRSEGVWTQGRVSGCWCPVGTGISLFC